MKNVVIRLDKALCKAKAKEYFMDICGLYKRKDISPRLLEESLQVLGDVYDRIEINAIYSRYDASSFGEGELVFEGRVFRCPALSRVRKDNVLEVITYLLTIGDVKILGERVLYQVYQDIWQTAFVDAGRDLLKDHIRSVIHHKTCAVSDTFGPGFFGMPATDTEKFFQILDAKRIGTRVRPDGLMIPLKSYVGFLLVTREEENLSSKDCENCLSSRKTCSYCKTGRQNGAAFELMSPESKEPHEEKDKQRLILP